jgi:hypothetical protein
MKGGGDVCMEVHTHTQAQQMRVERKEDFAQLLSLDEAEQVGYYELDFDAG